MIISINDKESSSHANRNTLAETPSDRDVAEHSRRDIPVKDETVMRQLEDRKCDNEEESYHATTTDVEVGMVHPPNLVTESDAHHVVVQDDNGLLRRQDCLADAWQQIFRPFCWQVAEIRCHVR